MSHETRLSIAIPPSVCVDHFHDGTRCRWLRWVHLCDCQETLTLCCQNALKRTRPPLQGIAFLVEQGYVLNETLYQALLNNADHLMKHIAEKYLRVNHTVDSIVRIVQCIFKPNKWLSYLRQFDFEKLVFLQYHDTVNIRNSAGTYITTVREQYMTMLLDQTLPSIEEHRLF
jgi:hypothetical protein